LPLCACTHSSGSCCNKPWRGSPPRRAPVPAWWHACCLNAHASMQAIPSTAAPTKRRGVRATAIMTPFASTTLLLVGALALTLVRNPVASAGEWLSTLGAPDPRLLASRSVPCNICAMQDLCPGDAPLQPPSAVTAAPAATPAAFARPSSSRLRDRRLPADGRTLRATAVPAEGWSGPWCHARAAAFQESVLGFLISEPRLPARTMSIK